MGQPKMVDPEEPSTDKPAVRIYKALPVLPREEAYRMRRAARAAADSLMPWVIQRYAEIADAEDPEVALKALNALRAISLAGKASEELDPEMPTIDGKVVSKGIEDLEKSTEGTGSGDVDG